MKKVKLSEDNHEPNQVDFNEGRKQFTSKSLSGSLNAMEFLSVKREQSSNDIVDFDYSKYFPWNEKFLWNYHLMKEFFSIIKDKRWVLPIIYGYIS